jgi:hypothetical protein
MTCRVRENDYSWCRLGLKIHFVKFVDRKCHLDEIKKMFYKGDNSHFLPSDKLKIQIQRGTK